MRIGEVRTSIKLEPEFWSYLKEVADSRSIRLSRLVNDVAMRLAGAHQSRLDPAHLLPDPRPAALAGARARARKLTLAGNTQDLTRVLDACPLPCLLLGEDRVIQRLNQAFASWLHVDGRGVLGQRLDNLMITARPRHAASSGSGCSAAWRTRRASTRPTSRPARCAPPRRWRSACRRSTARRSGACLVIFETLAGRG